MMTRPRSGPSAAVFIVSQLPRPACTTLPSRNCFSTTSRAQVDRRTHSKDPIHRTLIVPVPQEAAYIVERFGKYSRTLTSGVAYLIPFVDKIPYSQTLKEVAMPVPPQTAITADSVTVDIDGVIYTKVTDAYKASYGAENVSYAIQELVQTTMRTEVAKLTLEEVMRSRSILGAKIVQVVNEAAEAWGTTCLRYEIRDVVPPRSVMLAMQRSAMEKLFPQS